VANYNRQHTESVRSRTYGIRLIFSLVCIVSVLTLPGSSASAKTRATRTAAPHTWLAAGDSYSSGEGLPHAAGPCAQATNASGSAAWSVAASKILQRINANIALPSLVACTGATTEDFSTDPDGAGHPEWWPQMGRYDLVSFTFGGDNIGFASILIHCLTIGCPSDKGVRAKIARLAGTYEQFLLYVANHAVATGGNILVLGYPELVEVPKYWTPANKASGSCSGISESDARLIRGWAGDLNATIAGAVSAEDRLTARARNQVRMVYLDVNTGSNTGAVTIAPNDGNLFEPSTGARHNLCSLHPWLNSYSTIDGGAGSFHPKQAGQNAMGTLAAKVIDSLNWTSLVGAPPAQTFSWGPPIPLATNGAVLGGVSCASAAFCVAVDSDGDVYTYSGAAWSQPVLVDPNGGGLFRVSCPSSQFCVAIDHNGNALMLNGPFWSTPQPIDSSGPLNRVSCPDPSFCMVVDDSGFATSYNNGTWSQPESIDPNGVDDSDLDLTNLALSCFGPTFCEAVDGSGNALLYDGSSWSAPVSIDTSAGLLDVSCASSAFCAATDFGGAVLTYINGKWSEPQSVAAASGVSGTYGGSGYLLGSLFPSCPTDGFCRLVDALGDVTTLQNGSWSPPLLIDATGSPLSGVSCPTDAMCMAIDENGNAILGS
jgi:hypothetical protein